MKTLFFVILLAWFSILQGFALDKHIKNVFLRAWVALLCGGSFVIILNIYDKL